jgi:kinesin family member 11
MLAGYNCTIFAYGQTGTGKTYTMSGDMSDTMGLLSDAAGIIPRVLQALFNKLELDDTESCVKCSFIELYNEELRDLISIEEGTKLKIYDDTLRKGHATTVVQGMEEKHIKNAPEGIKVLQEGSLKRQVAATKCNDLSSRSHTVFTITAYIRRAAENGGEDYVSAGKLNLVDLAGSENIQRSGAENKRAAEAGLINKSLLTLGRVINALVDRSSHIPYRESKLTRLLQDSLGGRTKTCIIATVSPAKSNLEETISTLDYAFRAKNIRNKPQVNQMNKKMLLKDFTNEIERLKSELIATRLRNGVYLSNEAYEEMTAESDSRRIVLDEQAAKMETLETNLRNKVQELFNLTSTFMGLKKDHEGTKAQLDDAKGVLDQTELVLAATRKTLAEETHIRKAHQKTEEKLTELGGELISTIQQTVNDVGGLHAKNKRKSDLQNLNRSNWGTAQAQVAEVTALVERRVHEFQTLQEQKISGVSTRMQSFVGEELQKLSSTQIFLDEQLAVFADSKRDLMQETQRSKEEMDVVLEEIKVVRDIVKERVGESLQAISAAAERIAADVLSELTTFHSQVRSAISACPCLVQANKPQLHTSYSSLGKDFKGIFEELVSHIGAQRSESESLRQQLTSASNTILQQNTTISSRMQQVLEEERRQAAEDRQKLVAQISSLIDAQAERQESRLAGRAALLRQCVQESNTTFEGSVAEYGRGMDVWDKKEGQLLEVVARSRDTVKSKLKVDWTVSIIVSYPYANPNSRQAANEHSTSIQTTTKSVHAETVRVVDEQVKDLGVQMEALDDFVTRARSENAAHHDKHIGTVQNLSSTVEQSYGSISAHFKTTFDRVNNLGGGVDAEIKGLHESMEPCSEQFCQPLSELREDISSTVLREYEPTGDTPEKMQYQYPTNLPRTQGHDALIADLHAAPPTPSTATPVVFADLDHPNLLRPPPRPSIINLIAEKNPLSISVHDGKHSLSMSLREVNPNLTTNLTTGSLLFDPSASTMSAKEDNMTMPLFKRSTRIAKSSKRQAVVTLEGRENVPPSAFSQSLTRRKSPRLH